MSSINLLENAEISKTWNPRLLCGLTLALVFLAGGVVGAVTMDIGIHNRQKPLAFDTVQGKALYFDHMQKELDLTPVQAEQMQSVLNDFWQLYRTVLTDGKQRVEQLLNDEQKKKFERLLQHP